MKAFDGLLEVLKAECGLEKKRPVIVGVSGGPDSLCLLHLLHGHGFAVVAAHLDHGLRPESSQDAKVVEGYAQSLEIPYYSDRVDVAGFARLNSLSIEEAARERRYEFLFRLARELDAQAVAVGHTADDQVETVLMHLLRGAGLAGLRGMAYRTIPNPWSSSIAVVRPLLDIWREDVLGYCHSKELEPLFDRSNWDKSFFRNRMRIDLIPFLENYNPRIKTALKQSAQLLSADHEVLDGLTEKAWHKCVVRQSDNSLAFDRAGFSRQAVSLQRMLLRRAFIRLRPKERDIDFDAVQRALSFIQQPTAVGRRDWLAGLFLLVEDATIWIADWGVELPIEGPQLDAGQVLHLEVPGEVQLKADWQLRTAEVSLKDAIANDALENRDPYQIWFDAEKASDALTLRTRRPADRFQPLGMEDGSMKLADFMINVKLPRRARVGWPLICKGKEVLWVPGYRIAHPFALQEDTHRALHFRLAKSGG